MATTKAERTFYGKFIRPLINLAENSILRNRQFDFYLWGEGTAMPEDWQELIQNMNILSFRDILLPPAGNKFIFNPDKLSLVSDTWIRQRRSPQDQRLLMIAFLNGDLPSSGFTENGSNLYRQETIVKVAGQIFPEELLILEQNHLTDPDYRPYINDHVRTAILERLTKALEYKSAIQSQQDGIILTQLDSYKP